MKNLIYVLIAYLTPAIPLLFGAIFSIISSTFFLIPVKLSKNSNYSPNKLLIFIGLLICKFLPNAYLWVLGICTSILLIQDSIDNLFLKIIILIVIIFRYLYSWSSFFTKYKERHPDPNSDLGFYDLVISGYQGVINIIAFIVFFINSKILDPYFQWVFYLIN